MCASMFDFRQKQPNTIVSVAEERHISLKFNEQKVVN